MLVGRKRIELVVTDLDGTAVDSVGIYAKAENDFIKSFNKTLPCTNSEFYEKFFIENPNANRTDYYEYLVNFLDLPVTVEDSLNAVENKKIKLCKNVKYKNGADLVYRFIKNKGIPVGIATSSPRHFVEAMASSPYIKNSNMPFSDFDFILTSSDVENIKPFPDLYVGAMKEVGMHPSATFVMEDLPIGVTAALDAGIPQKNIAGLFDKYAKQTDEMIKSCGYWFGNHPRLLNFLEASNT